jgi:hypothetical protein
MILDRKNNEHTEDSASMQKSVMLSRERRNTRSLDLCVPILLMIFGKINGAKANSLGRLVRWPPLIIVRGRKLVLRANAIRFS